MVAKPGPGPQRIPDEQKHRRVERHGVRRHVAALDRGDMSPRPVAGSHRPNSRARPRTPASKSTRLRGISRSPRDTGFSRPFGTSAIR